MGLEHLKQYKVTHWIYNLLHYRKLRHNRAAYRKYHLRKPLVSSISSKDFPDKVSSAWLDLGESRVLAPLREAFQSFDEATRAGLLDWSERGYLILQGFFTPELADSIEAETGRLLAEGKLSFTHDHKLMFANRLSPLIDGITRDPGLMGLLQFILDREVVPFQTINFLKGLGQRAHSDSIHMTTYPLGYLIAVWIALEDMTPENGPLFYYPGSHRLPYLLNGDFNQGETRFRLGKKDYADYEDTLAAVIEKNRLEKKTFLAKKGDVLIWHANLIHGGSPVLNPKLTRKSMVVHYYARDVIKYHEITERPSLLESPE